MPRWDCSRDGHAYNVQLDGTEDPSCAVCGEDRELAMADPR